ncbi:MAG: alpha/beta hydrolase [Acidobacteria bacterium]|nr:alpha/beta hydrolase [Acidobacteriota bacterium]
MSEVVKPARSGRLSFEGHDLHWEYFGDGGREVVSLFNGLAMHTPAWYGFLPRLQPDYDVLLWDYPGQGSSSSHDVPYFIDRIAAGLEAILDVAGIERIHAMGVSWGGFVAVEFARQFQHRLHTLTLSGILLTREHLFDLYQDLSLRFYRGGPEQFELYTRYMYEKIFGEEFTRAAWDKLETMRSNFCDRYRGRIHALIRLTEAQNPFFAALGQRRAEYAAIGTPTLVVAGAEDRVILPRVQKKILEVIPHARWEEIEGSGHVVYLEQPDRFFTLLREFMAGKEESRPAAESGSLGSSPS